jgi:uncharacterized protein YjiS (DUF1127 family)
MSRISPPIFTVYSGGGHSLDDSEFDTTPDLRPVVYVPSLHPGARVAPYDPRFFRFDPGQHETRPVTPFHDAAPWLGEPQQGHADQRERGIGPFGGNSGGDPAGAVLHSVPRSEAQASVNVVPIAGNDADGNDAENVGCANRPASPSRSRLSSIVHGLIGPWVRWQRRREVARSITALSRLDDRSLRDIGIHHRLQISERVRSKP